MHNKASSTCPKRLTPPMAVHKISKWHLSLSKHYLGLLNNNSQVRRPDVCAGRQHTLPVKRIPSGIQIRNVVSWGVTHHLKPFHHLGAFPPMFPMFRNQVINCICKTLESLPPRPSEMRGTLFLMKPVENEYISKFRLALGKIQVMCVLGTECVKGAQTQVSAQMITFLLTF